LSTFCDGFMKRNWRALCNEWGYHMSIIGFMLTWAWSLLLNKLNQLIDQIY